MYISIFSTKQSVTALEITTAYGYNSTISNLDEAAKFTLQPVSSYIFV